MESYSLEDNINLLYNYVYNNLDDKNYDKIKLEKIKINLFESNIKSDFEINSICNIRPDIIKYTSSLP